MSTSSHCGLLLMPYLLAPSGSTSPAACAGCAVRSCSEEGGVVWWQRWAVLPDLCDGWVDAVLARSRAVEMAAAWLLPPSHSSGPILPLAGPVFFLPLILISLMVSRGKPWLVLNLAVLASGKIVLASWKYWRPVISSTVLQNPSHRVQTTDAQSHLLPRWRTEPFY